MLIQLDKYNKPTKTQRASGRASEYANESERTGATRHTEEEQGSQGPNSKAPEQNERGNEAKNPRTNEEGGYFLIGPTMHWGRSSARMRLPKSGGAGEREVRRHLLAT